MLLEKIKALINNPKTSNNISQVTLNAFQENQNIFEQNQTSYNQYNQTFDDNWEDVKFEKDKFLGFLWYTGNCTYTTSNGSTITVKNTDGITVKQNKQTGEIVIIGGNTEDINLAEGNNLTLIEATAKNINASSGDATIKIEGSHTSVANVTGGYGSQSVIVSAGAKVEKINTGDDDDAVIINNSQVGKVETGKGNDGIIVYNSTITNNVDLGKDNDYLLLEESNVQGKLIATKGSNIIDASETELNDNIDLNSGYNDTSTINLSKSTINGDIFAYDGNANITIENGSTLAENKKIRTGYGNYNITVNDSNLDGNLVASGFEGNGSYESFNLNLDNSSFNNISGLRDDDYTKFNSNNSKSSGAENVADSNNSKIEVTPLNIDEGEFQGFELVKPESADTRKIYTVKISDTQTGTVSEEEWKQRFLGNFQLLSENVQNVYTLSDGTTVSLNEGGQVYTNPATGEIVINGADKAEISGGNNKNSKITVINSNVLSQNNVSGNIEYRNSNVDIINVLDSEDTQITIKDDSRIGDISSNNSNLTVVTLDTSKIKNIISSGEGQVNINSNGGEISKIQSTQADITGNIQNVTIGTIKTTKGSINLTANKSKINNIENTNQNGKTNLDFSEVTLSKITSNSISDINLDNCKVTSKIKTSDKDDIFKLIDSEIKNLETKQGKDDIYVSGGELEKITSSGSTNTIINGADIDQAKIQGDIAIYKSNINSIRGYGNIAVKASEIDNLDVYDDISNVYIKDSLILNDCSLFDDNAHIDNFGVDSKEYGNLDNAENSKLNLLKLKLDKLSDQEINNVYTLLENISIDEINEAISKYDYLNLSDDDKAEIAKLAQDDPKNPVVIVYGLIDEMQDAITTLEQALVDDKNSMGYELISRLINSISNDINASNIQSKKEMLSKAIKSGDFESLLNAHTILTDEISATNAITEYNNALTYANTISNDDIGNILTTLNYIGNLMEYNITEQDGVIKKGIAYLNMYFDIGTNRAEAQAYVQTFKDNVNKLIEKYNNGTLTNEELVSEYKRLTGNSFTKNNVETILDNARNNDAFKNIAESKIEDYQETQQTIMQVGEYAITIVAGSAVTLVSGGAAGPAIAAALSAAGKMGVALTATTVSFLTKTAIEATERQTNGIVADDMTAEEIATSAALMYAGCLCGQFGNAVGDYIRGSAPEFLSRFISSKEVVNIVSKAVGKTLEIAADTGASVATTAMITGSGEWNEEFMQNLRSELIGLIQSKITGAYFKAHPEIQYSNTRYAMQKAGYSAEDANIKILTDCGISQEEAINYIRSGLTNDEVDTLATISLLKGTESICETTLKEHGIDASKLSTEEKLEQGKIVDNLYKNVDKIKQQTSSTCSVVSVLNAINDKPILLQALANKFEYDATNDTYKFNMFNDEFEVKLNEGDNLLQKAYEAYQIQYGDTKTSAIDVFNTMLDGASDIIVRPSADNIQTLKGYTEDEASILTFNTTDKIDGISSGHSYTVLSVDDMGNIKLQDPETLEEITILRASYENKDCQIQGKTYRDGGLVEDGVELKLAAGKYPDSSETREDSLAKIVELAEKQDIQGCKSCEEVIEALKEKNMISDRDYRVLIHQTPEQQEKTLKIMLMSDCTIDAKTAVKMGNFDADTLENIMKIYNEKLITKENLAKLVNSKYANETAELISKLGNKVDFENLQKLAEYVKSSEDANSLNSIIEIFNVNTSRNNNEIAISITKFLEKHKLQNPDFNITDFNEYIKKIDFNKLKDQYPVFEDYEVDNWMNFLNYHLGEQKTEFSESDLAIDLTKYLKQNFLNADKLSEILDVFPLSQRAVGEIPEGWVPKRLVSDKGLLASIDEAIVEFADSRDEYMFEYQLQEIIGKEVNVKRIGSGKFGTVYRVSVEGSDDVCIKLFHDVPQMKSDPNIHGGRVEPQTAMFANEHSDRFVKMYMAHVASEQDPTSYMVMQHLSDDTDVKSTGSGDNEDYWFYPVDDHDENYFTANDGSRVYFDFGAVKISRITMGPKGKKCIPIHDW